MEFIFMLTHHDVTIENAFDVLEEVKDTGLKNIGCKDIGLKLEEYDELFSQIRKYDMKSFLEVVTYSEAEHFKGVDLALKLGVDNLIGGMPKYTKKTIRYLREKHSKTRFFPYIGDVSGHPCVLTGEIEKIMKDGEETREVGIDGINLLLYRYSGDQSRLLGRIKELKIPVIVAGNVASFEQINELKANGIWAFTIGGAVIEKKFGESESIGDQVKTILQQL